MQKHDNKSKILIKKIFHVYYVIFLTFPVLNFVSLCLFRCVPAPIPYPLSPIPEITVFNKRFTVWNFQSIVSAFGSNLHTWLHSLDNIIWQGINQADPTRTIIFKQALQVLDKKWQTIIDKQEELPALVQEMYSSVTPCLCIGSTSYGPIPV